MADLEEYEVPVRNHTTTVQLSDAEAKAYRAEGLKIRKVGDVAPAERQDVTAPPHAVDEDGEPLPEADAGTVRSRSRTAPKNK